MADWLIIRTDARKEAYVCRQLQNLGFQAWHPVQIIACRPSIARRVTAKAHLANERKISILPRRVFAAVPLGLQANIAKIRHFVSIERDAALMPLQIPERQIQSFLAAVNAENAAALALATKASRKQKARWRDLKEALLELIDGAKNQLEQAA